MATAAFLFTLLVQWIRSRGLVHETIPGTEWLLTQVRDPWSNEGSPQAEDRGTLRSLRLGPHCPSLGRPLSELDLPGRADVTVVALLREGCTPLPLHPSPELREGDLLALAGSEHALNEAEHLLGEQV